MARSKSSHRWMQRHLNDPYVKRAQRAGYRSRAAYKLLEIQEKDHLVKPGGRVADLGAAPGGWSQIASQLVGKQGQVFALDILTMEPIPGVTFIEGDFREERVLDEMRRVLSDQPLDLVISDMAPNVTGVVAVDQPRSMHLCELALAFAQETLKPGGGFVVKIFHGSGFDTFVREVKSSFRRVATRKPNASRAKSREVYLVAGNYDS